MTRALAGLIGIGNGLIPPSRRPAAAADIRGYRTDPLAIMTWRRWSGELRFDSNPAWWIMLAGVFGNDGIARWAEHRDRAQTEESA